MCSEKFYKPCKSDLIERDDKNYQELASNIQEVCRDNNWDSTNISYYQGEYQDVIPRILPRKRKNELGLTFVDPSGDLPDFDVLRYIAEVRPRM